VKRLKKELKLSEKDIEWLDMRFAERGWTIHDAVRGILYEEVPDPVFCWKCGRETQARSCDESFSRSCISCGSIHFPYCETQEMADKAARILYAYLYTKKETP